MAEIGTATIKVIPEFDPDIPRIQILELPSMAVGDYFKTPFAVVIDGTPHDSSLRNRAEELREALGAVCVIFTKERVAV